MHILVLQHAVVEHPGIFRSFLARDGHSYDAVELDQGEVLPALDAYDALWVMGGPMDVWQEAAHPWLKPESSDKRGGADPQNAVSGAVFGPPAVGRSAGRSCRKIQCAGGGGHGGVFDR